MSKAKRITLHGRQVSKHILKLPQTIQDVNQSLAQHTENLQNINEITNEHTIGLQNQLDQIKALTKAYDRLDIRVANLQHLLTQQSDNKTTPKEQPHDAPTVVNNTVADNHNYDMFYKEFEDKFRGSESLIRERVAEHLPRFAELPIPVKKKKVVDIGCGRGEFLQVAQAAGLTAHGIDMNGDMVRRANDKGLSAEQIDALSYLKKQASDSLSAVTGFHIVEHIPFEPLMEIFQECYRAVAKGGFVLFETPNPNSLQVGANTFYTDPSHLRPVPNELLAFMLEFNGFETEFVPLHKQHESLKSTNKKLVELYDTVFGFADYAIIGRKI